MNLKRDTFKVFKCLYKTLDEFDELCWKILTGLYYDKFKDLIKNDRDAKLKHLKILRILLGS